MHLNLGINLSWSSYIDPTLLYRGCAAADPDFFSLYPCNKEDITSVLSALSGDYASDYYQPLVAKEGGVDQGFLFAYPLSEMFSRQTHSLRRLLALTPNAESLRAGLKLLSSSKASLKNSDSFYLARIYVEVMARGGGIGRLLMQEFADVGKRRGFSTLSLHVRQENTNAHDFYKGLGFVFSDHQVTGYRSMEKQI
jgi:ribosomal protein S18 acetylase RimI-like enzyme